MNKYAIEGVLPHAHPMIFIDELIDSDAKSAKARLKITDKSHFFNAKRNAVPAYVGIEYMAQTIAAYANVLKLEEGNDVALGFLVSARKYSSSVAEFDLGSELQVNIDVVMKEGNGLSVFDCTIIQDQDVLVEAKINVYEPEDPEAYLKEKETP